MPCMAYFEFLEIKKNYQEAGHDPKDVDLVDVKIGHDYEPVTTTFSGKFLFNNKSFLAMIITCYNNMYI